MESILNQDVDAIVADQSAAWSMLAHRNVFITGATGLIGSLLTRALLQANRVYHLDMGVLILARNPEKANQLFGQDPALRIFQGTVENLPHIPEDIDYVIHGASQTASKQFITNPVDTINTALKGTEGILELARMKQVKGMVYLSTMQVYGHPPKGMKVTEDKLWGLDSMQVRNSYPLSKLACESICCGYASQYQVPVSILRLTQTFGSCVEYNDKRVFAEFARCAIEKRNIVLKTAGDTERSYLYTADAVCAILTALTKGKAGEAYNAANEQTYCSILQMAELVAEIGGVSVELDLGADAGRLGYASTLYMDLDTTKLRRLGWSPRYGLKEMYCRTIDSMRQNC